VIIEQRLWSGLRRVRKGTATEVDDVVLVAHGRSADAPYGHLFRIRFQVSLLIGHEVAHVPCEETLVGDESASSLPREVAVDLERHSLLGG